MSPHGCLECGVASVRVSFQLFWSRKPGSFTGSSRRHSVSEHDTTGLFGFSPFCGVLFFLGTGLGTPSIFRVITAIFTIINLTWIASLEAPFEQCRRLACAFCFVDPLAEILEEDPVAYIVVLPNCQGDEVALREPLENLVRSPSAERRVLIVLDMEAFEHLNTQDKR